VDRNKKNFNSFIHFVLIKGFLFVDTKLWYRTVFNFYYEFEFTCATGFENFK
jgi:hypothetical protein